MAKKPTTTTPTPAPAAAAPAPASPWAPGDAGANPSDAASAPAGGDTAGQEAAAGNGGGTPLGEDAPRGDIFDEAGNVLQSRDNTSDTVSQPPKAPDNEPSVTAGGLSDNGPNGPSGRLERRPELSDLRDELGDLTEEEEAEFRAVIEDTARTELNRIRRNRKAKEIEVSLVDGNKHFGTLAEKATADSAVKAEASDDDGEGE